MPSIRKVQLCRCCGCEASRMPAEFKPTAQVCITDARPLRSCLQACGLHTSRNYTRHGNTETAQSNLQMTKEKKYAQKDTHTHAHARTHTHTHTLRTPAQIRPRPSGCGCQPPGPGRARAEHQSAALSSSCGCAPGSNHYNKRALQSRILWKGRGRKLVIGGRGGRGGGGKFLPSQVLFFCFLACVKLHSSCILKVLLAWKSPVISRPPS